MDLSDTIKTPLGILDTSWSLNGIMVSANVGYAVRQTDSSRIEAFAGMPDFQLTVCGPIDADYERHFRAEFNAELFASENIRTVGWVDVSSDAFRDILSNSVGLVYPSASEGQAGAVVTCMQGGLIPVISYESGVDVDDYGIILSDCSVETIRNTIQNLASEPVDQLRQRATSAWQYARDNHTPEHYRDVYRSMIESILAQSASR